MNNIKNAQICLARSLDEITIAHNGCVLTIGNFDAVHIGHQKILRQLVKVGDNLGLPVVVMTFIPSPEEYFRKQQTSARLTTASGRYFALRQHRVDMMLALPFNQTLAQTSAAQFIKQYLVDGLNAKYILIGDDFKFGQARQGDYRLLKAAGQEHGFTVERFETVEDGSGRVSSTRIRALLNEGDLDGAKQLLGRSFSLVGRVIHGDKRGTEWGFPTANLPLNRTLPMRGVFAVTVRDETDGYANAINGVANLGQRPTIGGMKTLLEVHLLGFDKQIYGHRICVEFVKKIRDEAKFDSFDALQRQIFSDCEHAREYFWLNKSKLQSS